MIKHQKGFTLVEVMIAVMLGTLLMTGVTQLFSQSNKAFRKQRAQSNMMEDGRYIVELMAQEFRRAGYLNNPLLLFSVASETKTAAQTFFTPQSNILSSGINMRRGDFLQGSFSASGLGSPANIHDLNHIVLRYQVATANEPGNSPCSSNFGDTGVDKDDIKVVYFYVSTDGTLTCDAETYRGSTLSKSMNAVPLISNVERLDVLYGVDKQYLDTGERVTDTAVANGYGYADEYMTASDLNATPLTYWEYALKNGKKKDELPTNQSRWSTVVSVRITLVLRSETGISTPASSTISGIFTINSQTSLLKLEGADTRMYRAFNTTVMIRN